MPIRRALRGVREQRGLDVAKVASFASIAVDRLRQFEAGEREPSRKQMQKLADIYGVPLYALFHDSIPNLPPLPTDFRKTDPRPAELSPAGVKTLLWGERISQFTAQLAAELDYEAPSLDASAHGSRSPQERAVRLRSAFDEWYIPKQADLGFSGAAEQRFMGALRLFFEIQGGIVNVNEAPFEDYLGYFLDPSAGLPTIFVNRSVSSKKAQLFTLVHEYCHALIGVEGISDPFRSKNNVERECNAFAAEFLAPMDQFSKVVEGFDKQVRSNISNFISCVSASSLLSKHAAAIRLVEGDYISAKDLRSWRRLFVAKPKAEKEEEKEAASGGGGQPHAKRISELGHLPVYLAKRAVDERLIDAYDVADGIGLSTTLQDRAYSLVARRFAAALP